MHRNLAVALGTAGVYLGGALALKAAERAGILAPDTGGRALMVLSGLLLAVYANFLPKTLGRFRNPAAALRMEQVMRVSGWAYTLGGLAFAIAALAPVSSPVSIALLATATAYALGYAVRAFMEPGQCRDTSA